MILRDTLARVLGDHRPAAAPPPEIRRAIFGRLPKGSQQALVLTGVRRCGKSILQAQLMRAAPAGAAYLNLEDTRLFGLGPEDFPTLVELLEEQARAKAVFLDEVQEVDQWQRLVRALLDRGHAVCLTGSNASLLGRELGTKLTGRHRSFEVFPFCYEEYVSFTGAARGAESLQAYLDDGGFPGYLHERDPQVLQELLRDVVQRDIAHRHHLRETRHVMNLALFLLANTGRPLSLQGLTKTLKIPTVGQTSRYVKYLEDAYLIFPVPMFSTSFKQRVVTPNKYYAIDNGLRRANSPNLTPDRGHRLENAVFLSLRQRGQVPRYAGQKDAWECDFVTDDLAIQVCAELTPFNRERELGGLRRALDLPGRRRGLVITLDQKDVVSLDGTRIEVLPAWAWLTS